MWCIELVVKIQGCLAFTFWMYGSKGAVQKSNSEQKTLQLLRRTTTAEEWFWKERQGNVCWPQSSTSCFHLKNCLSVEVFSVSYILCKLFMHIHTNSHQQPWHSQSHLKIILQSDVWCEHNWISWLVSACFATWLSKWIAAWMSRCTGLPTKLYSEHISK